jgi:epoxyqueuosine reductase QueG
MKKRLSELLMENKIDCFGFLPLNACEIQKAYLLERVGIQSGTVIIFAMPYYTRVCDGEKNLSSYAVGKDYHLYFKILSEKILETLRAEFPSNRFAAFADHSPINERKAAAKAGIGILGKNGLLITEKYSSYVFLGEIITDAESDAEPKEIRHCPNCGSCESICPWKTGEIGECLSWVTQKKVSLSAKEEAAIRKHKTVWGCDLCQEICPYTKNAKKRGTLYTPLTFFEEETLPTLSAKTVFQMDTAAFASRAYSWRGREVILRNLSVLETKNALTKECEETQDFPQKDKP